jgi:hypothetical protein
MVRAQPLLIIQDNSCTQAEATRLPWAFTATTQICHCVEMTQRTVQLRQLLRACRFHTYVHTHDQWLNPYQTRS